MFKHKKREGDVPKDFKSFTEKVKKPFLPKMLAGLSFHLTKIGLVGTTFWKATRLTALIYQDAPNAALAEPMVAMLQTGWSAFVGIEAHKKGKGIELYRALIPMLKELAPEAKKRVANVKAYVDNYQGRVEQIREDVAYMQALLAVGKVLKKTRKAYPELFKEEELAKQVVKEPSKHKMEVMGDYGLLSALISGTAFVFPYILDPATYFSYSTPWGLLLLPFAMIPAGMAVSSISKDVTLWGLKRDIEKEWKPKKDKDGEELRKRAQKVLQELEGLREIFKKIEQHHEIPQSPLRGEQKVCLSVKVLRPSSPSLREGENPLCHNFLLSRKILQRIFPVGGKLYSNFSRVNFNPWFNFSRGGVGVIGSREALDTPLSPPLASQRALGRGGRPQGACSAL